MPEEKEYIPFPSTEVRHTIMFGNGTDGASRGSRKNLLKGKIIIKYRPSPYMSWFHQVQDEEKLSATEDMTSEIDNEFLVDLTSNQKASRLLSLVDYKNRPTPLLKHYILEPKLLMATDIEEVAGMSKMKITNLFNLLNERKLLSFVEKGSLFDVSLISQVKRLKEENLALKRNIERMNHDRKIEASNPDAVEEKMGKMVERVATALLVTKENK